MGCDIGNVTFTEESYARFRARLADCLRTLGHVVRHPEFGTEPCTLGAELEVSLVGEDGRPASLNAAVAEALHDDLLTLEVARFNLEANLRPVLLRGRPFTAMAAQAARTLERVTAWSLPRHGVRVAPIGTLPTLTPGDLTAAALTPLPRYHVLEQAWALRRPTPFTLRVADGDLGSVQAQSVAVQGAACSWQIHLTVPPNRFRRTFDAARLATGPALAAAGNSALPLGRSGWQESRIPLYEQGFGDRSTTPGGGTFRPRVGFGRGWLRGGPLAAFEEAVHRYDVLLPARGQERADGGPPGAPYPALEELQIHLSTVWSWNRPVYDPLGHLRIEFRALPSGPTPLDMAANTAFLVGLTLFLAADGRDVARELPFTCAEANFYRAARDGLDASLWWPSPGSAPREHCAGALVKELLPQAREGLALAAVDADEADALLDLLHHRVATGRTGAWWQQRTREVLRRRRETGTGGRGEVRGRREVRELGELREPGEAGVLGELGELGELTVRYARLAAEAGPVHTWNVPDLPPWSQR
ncbi:glutamate--cysteine ligase [Streptomyces sp. NPDC017940]|uniref:glutamate--cysteine ligase n=1 Tax=Streptomyces sp. NPDC017940 TaxID=3365017 RepID=UPI00378DDC70